MTGFALPTLVGAGSHVTGTGPSLAVPYPASGVLAKDVAVLLWGGNSATVPASQTGWSNETRISSTGNTLVPDLYCGTKIMAGTESGTSFTITTPSVVVDGQILVFRGIDNVTVLDVSTSTLDKTSTSTGNYAITGVTTTRPGAVLVYAVIANSGSQTCTPPGTLSGQSWTEDADLSTGRSFSTGHLIWNSQGATGTVTPVESSTVRGLALLLALRPSTVGGIQVVTQAISRSAVF